MISARLDEQARAKLAKLVVLARGERSQVEFAKTLGVSQSTVQGWETQKNVPTLENLEKLAEHTNQLPEVLLAYLYGRDVGSPLGLRDRISDLSIEELSMVLDAVARRLAQGE